VFPLLPSASKRKESIADQERRITGKKKKKNLAKVLADGRQARGEGFVRIWKGDTRTDLPQGKKGGTPTASEKSPPHQAVGDEGGQRRSCRGFRPFVGGKEGKKTTTGEGKERYNTVMETQRLKKKKTVRAAKVSKGVNPQHRGKKGRAEDGGVAPHKSTRR